MELTDEKPVEPGWYATTVSWDESEGSFESVHYWTGNKWLDRPDNDTWWTNAYILHWPERFDSKEAAEAKAETLPTW